MKPAREICHFHTSKFAYLENLLDPQPICSKIYLKSIGKEEIFCTQLLTDKENLVTDTSLVWALGLGALVYDLVWVE